MAARSEGTAGGSARREAVRRKTNEDERRRALKQAHPLLGRLKLAAEGRSTAGESYMASAIGEEKLGARLDALAGDGVFVLHDRRRPNSTANIDHVAIAATGVWVVDAKHYRGSLRRVDKGGLLRTDHRLVVGGRDRSALADGVLKQIADVRRALEGNGYADVAVRGALCFVDAEVGLLTRPFAIRGVTVTWPRALCKQLRSSGPLDEATREAVHVALARTLPSAS